MMMSAAATDTSRRRSPRCQRNEAAARLLARAPQLQNGAQDAEFRSRDGRPVIVPARYVHGTVLLPYETFSMNDTIKERTREHGYTEGFVIGPGGSFREDLGGGVSTATTAVWTAAFFAGME